MFDYLFTLMGPLGSAFALTTVLLTIAAVVSLARCADTRRLVGPRF